MKSYINKLSRKSVSNSVIAAKLGVSEGMIHRHRKRLNKLVDKAIYTHFFMKSPKLYNGSLKSLESVPTETFLDMLLRFLRHIFSPFHRVYVSFTYK